VIAETMRSALAETVWDPAGDPTAVVAMLTVMISRVCDSVGTVDMGLTVFESTSLSAAYLFCASLQKSLSLEYHRQHPDLRGISAAEHLAKIQPHLVEFHQRQQVVVQLIDAEFPPQV